MRQGQFNIQPKTDFAIENFVVSACNKEAATLIETWPGEDQPYSGHSLLVHGCQGAGKTHLAYIWQQKTGAAFIGGDDINNAQIADLVHAGSCFVLDALDLYPQIKESNLLHLLNVVAEQRKYLLITSRVAPAKLGFKLPDLSSRVNALPAVEIHSPDEELLRAVIIKYFSDRSLRISRDVVNFLVNNIERSFSAIKDVVELLDQRSLEDGRRITLRLVKDSLKSITA